MGIGFAHHVRRQSGTLAAKAGAGRPEKARDRKIEASPKEMHGAAFAEEAGAKFLQHAVGQAAELPEPPCIFRVVTRHVSVPAEGRRVRDLTGPSLMGPNPSSVSAALPAALKMATLCGRNAETPPLAVAEGDVEYMLEKIELISKVRAPCGMARWSVPWR